MKKTEFHAVYRKGETEPVAIFIKSTDAKRYDYVRFGQPGVGAIADHEVLPVMIPNKKAYTSLAFKEGLAFIKVMKIKHSLFVGMGP